MIRKLKIKLFLSLFTAVFFGLSLSASANSQTQKSRTAFSREEATQQPLYTNYKGVQLGMSATEARAKLGAPALKDNDQDYYVFSENETAQIGYDAAHKVIAISVDYAGGIGAPDYKTIVGAELVKSDTGSMFRAVRYESLGFWVSYYRTNGMAGATVTVTIQRIM